MVIEASPLDDGFVQSPRIVRDYLARSREHLDISCSSGLTEVYDQLLDTLYLVHDHEVANKMSALKTAHKPGSRPGASTSSEPASRHGTLRPEQLRMQGTALGQSQIDGDDSSSTISQLYEADPLQYVPAPLSLCGQRSFTSMVRKQSSWETIGYVESRGTKDEAEHDTQASEITIGLHPNSSSFSRYPSPGGPSQTYSLNDNSKDLKVAVSAGLGLAKDKWVERDHFPFRRSSLGYRKQGYIAPLSPGRPDRSGVGTSSGLRDVSAQHRDEQDLAGQVVSRSDISLEITGSGMLSTTSSTTANGVQRSTTVACLDSPSIQRQKSTASRQSSVPSLSQSIATISTSPSNPRTPRLPFTKPWAPPVYSPKALRREPRVEAYHQQLAQSPFFSKRLRSNAVTDVSTFKFSRELDNATTVIEEVEVENFQQMAPPTDCSRGLLISWDSSKNSKKRINSAEIEEHDGSNLVTNGPHRTKSSSQSHFSTVPLRPEPLALDKSLKAYKNEPSKQKKSHDTPYHLKQLPSLDSTCSAMNWVSQFSSQPPSCPLPQLPPLDFRKSPTAEADRAYREVLETLKQWNTISSEATSRASVATTPSSSSCKRMSKTSAEMERDVGQKLSYIAQDATLPQASSSSSRQSGETGTGESVKRVKFASILYTRPESVSPPPTSAKPNTRKSLRKMASMTAEHLQKRFSVHSVPEGKAPQSQASLSSFGFSSTDTAVAEVPRKPDTAYCSMANLIQIGESGKAVEVLGGREDVEKWRHGLLEEHEDGTRQAKKDKDKFVKQERKEKAANAVERVSRLLTLGWYTDDPSTS